MPGLVGIQVVNEEEIHADSLAVVCIIERRTAALHGK